MLGVNSPLQLAELERRFQRAQADALMQAGVRLADPARFDLRGQMQCGMDVEIDVGCVFEGRVELGDGVRIGAHCVIRDARIAAGAVVHPFTHIEGATIGAFALTIDRCCPRIRFMSVDFPTFGFPMMLTKPALCAMRRR